MQVLDRGLELLAGDPAHSVCERFLRFERISHATAEQTNIARSGEPGIRSEPPGVRHPHRELSAESSSPSALASRGLPARDGPRASETPSSLSKLGALSTLSSIQSR